MRRTTGIALTLGVLFAAAAAPANAAETLGKTGTANACTENTTYITPSVSSGPDYVPDASGVITSYSMLRSGVGTGTRQLEVFQPNGADNFTVVQKDIVRELPDPNVVNKVIGLHVPIVAGQAVGVFIPAGQPNTNGECLSPTGNALDTFQFFGGDPSFGASTGFSVPGTTVRLNLEATVEPDADGDGYGDETQDLCPANAGVQSTCPVTAPPPPPAETKKKCEKKKGKKRSAEAAKKKSCKKKKKKK